MHWYLECMNHAKDCLREFTFDYLKNVNTEIIKVESDHTIKLPCDYVDWTKVGVRAGQYIKPLIQYDKFSRVENQSGGLGEAVGGWEIPWINVSQDGEHLGRLYGLGAGREKDVFMEIRERGVIQLSEKLEEDYVVLEYISDGQTSSAATQVHPYAQSAIEYYIDWKITNFSKGGEKQLRKFEYEQAVRKLVARLNPITVEDVKRIYRRSYRGSIKS